MEPSKRIPRETREALQELVGAPLGGSLLFLRETKTYVTEVREFPGGRVLLTQLERLPSDHEAHLALARSMAPLLGFEPALILVVSLEPFRVHPEAMFRLARPHFHFQLYAYELGKTLTLAATPEELFAPADRPDSFA